MECPKLGHIGHGSQWPVTWGPLRRIGDHPDGDGLQPQYTSTKFLDETLSTFDVVHLEQRVSDFKDDPPPFNVGGKSAVFWFTWALAASSLGASWTPPEHQSPAPECRKIICEAPELPANSEWSDWEGRFSGGVAPPVFMFSMHNIWHRNKLQAFQIRASVQQSQVQSICISCTSLSHRAQSPRVHSISF